MICKYCRMAINSGEEHEVFCHDGDLAFRTHQTTIHCITALLAEVERLKAIERSGRTRKTRSGCSAAVMVAARGKHAEEMESK